MRDQAPLHGFAQGRADRRRGFPQGYDALDGRASLQFEIASLISKRQAGGQIAIGTRGAYRQRVGGWAGGLEGQVHQRQIQLRAIVVGPHGGAPVGDPERLLLVALRGVPERIERLILDHFLLLRFQAGHAVHREDFHGHGPPGIRNNRVFVLLLVEQDGFGRLREQVHHGSAAEAEGGRRDAGFQTLAAFLALEAREQEDQFHAAFESRPASLPQTGYVHEEELVHEGEIFLQEPVTDERAPRVGEHALVFFKSKRTQGGRRQRDSRQAGTGRGVARDDLQQIAAEYFVNGVDQRALAVQEKPEPIQLQLGELHVGGVAGQFDAQRSRRVRRPQWRFQAVGRGPGGRRNGNGPERGVVAGAELARNPIHRARVKQGFARDGTAGGELAFLRIQVELGDRHGRQRPDEMRIDDTQQRLGNLRKLVVDLQVDARRQKGKAFQQPLHVRIVALGRLQDQPRGDLGILLGELRAQLAHVRQLALVVQQQVIPHSGPRTRRWSVPAPCRTRRARAQDP